MGNYYAENPVEMLNQLQEWIKGKIYNATIIDNICCYLIECEGKITFNYYREIDFAEKRLFSASIRIPSTTAEKDELTYMLERMAPTWYMARALKCMGVI